jgi:hypothetical protein
MGIFRFILSIHSFSSRIKMCSKLSLVSDRTLKPRSCFECPRPTEFLNCRHPVFAVRSGGPEPFDRARDML